MASVERIIDVVGEEGVFVAVRAEELIFVIRTEEV